VLSSQVQNFSTEAKRLGLILHTTVTIGYDWPWRKIHELLVSAATATPNVLKEPRPFVLQTSLDDFYVSYQLNAYTDDASVMGFTSSRLHENIQDAFFDAGVEIMSPHYLAARDGNAPAIPADKVPKGFKVPAFRVETGPREG
jgi:small-conductance mechanosensitive channel